MADNSFSPQYISGSIDHYKFDDQDGRGLYCKSGSSSHSNNSKTKFEYKGYSPPEKGWRWNRKKMASLDDDGLLSFPSKLTGRIMRKRYLSEYKGVAVNDIWTDINSVRPGSAESTCYPTQKPVALYERIIRASCTRDGVVLDPFCGSGTTLVAAKNLGCSYIGVDQNVDAVRISNERLKSSLI